MLTADLLEQLCHVADRLGYRVRMESLAGGGGGVCTLKGQTYLFIDAVLPIDEQIEQIAEALAGVDGLDQVQMPAAIKQLLAEFGADMGPSG